MDRRTKVPLPTTANLKLAIIPGALKFDVSYFETYPGTDFTINFKNNRLMAHNWLLTLPGRVDDLVTAAMAMDAQEGQQSGYLTGGFFFFIQFPIWKPFWVSKISFNVYDKDFVSSHQNQ